MARFKPLGGKSRRYLDTKTGETISRRAYQKITQGLSFEEKAAFNRAQDATTSILRPARGRKSALKGTATEKNIIAEARLEAAKRQREIAKAEKERKAVARKIARVTGRKTKRRKITKKLLKPGSFGARVSFDDYDEYLAILNEARQTGVIFSYGLGMVGVNENTGQDLGITVFRMTFLGDTIPRDEFEYEMSAALEERAYFMFAHYFMHLAFKKEYAQQLALTARSAGRGKKQGQLLRGARRSR